MKRHDKLAETIPVGTLGILALESSKSMGQKVNDYIVDWRAERAAQHSTASSFAGYNRDSYIIDSACPRFGSGEAKGRIKESIRGKKFYDGVLTAYDGKTVTLKVDEKPTFTIELKSIVKMNEYIDFN